VNWNRTLTMQQIGVDWELDCYMYYNLIPIPVWNEMRIRLLL